MKTTEHLNEKKTQYRWVVCAMLFLAIVINYLDRQVLSLTWPKYIGPEFGWTNSDYGSITSWFSLFYAICMLFVGRFIDWLDTKKGFLLAVGIWSIGACLHAFCSVFTLGKIGGVWFVDFEKIREIIDKLKESNAGYIISSSITFFLCARLVLAFGEAGNFPAAIKTTTEYFPKKDRAFSTSIFNSGATIGAMIAPTIILYVASIWSWEMAFIIIGLLGFTWMGLWILIYQKPEVHPRVNKAELEYIQQDKYLGGAAETIKETKLSFMRCFQFRQTWAFAIGKFMTDGVWWFYLFWMPKYLQTVFKLEGKAQIFPLTIFYMIVMLSIIGGWLPTFFIEKKEMNPYAGRMKAMLIFAFIPLLVLFAQPLGIYTYWWPIILIGMAGAAHQAWSANIFSIIGDMFPQKAIATITGIGGMAGGIGSFLIQKTAGELFDYANSTQMSFGGFEGESVGYFIIFCICAITYLIGWIFMKRLVPVYKPIINL